MSTIGLDDDGDDFNVNVGSQLSSLFNSKINYQEDDDIFRSSSQSSKPKGSSASESNASASDKKSSDQFQFVYQTGVIAYKFMKETGQYENHGKCGCGIMCQPSSRAYMVTLFKKKYITTATIGDCFKLIIQTATKVLFTDDSSVIWSISFIDCHKMASFLRLMCLAKFFKSRRDFIAQETKFIDGEKADLTENCVEIEVKTFTFNLQSHSLSEREMSLHRIDLRTNERWRYIIDGLKITGREFFVGKAEFSSSLEIFGQIHENDEICCAEITLLRANSESDIPDTPEIAAPIAESAKQAILSKIAKVGIQTLMPPMNVKSVMTKTDTEKQVKVEEQKMKINEAPLKLQQPIDITDSTSPIDFNENSDETKLKHEINSASREVKSVIGEVSSKLDNLDDKVCQLNSKMGSNSSLFLDTAMILGSVEKIIHENISLKKELEEKSTKLTNLNEKMCQVLEQMSSQGVVGGTFNFDERSKHEELLNEVSFLKATNERLLEDMRLFQERMRLENIKFDEERRLALDERQNLMEVISELKNCTQKMDTEMVDVECEVDGQRRLKNDEQEYNETLASIQDLQGEKDELRREISNLTTERNKLRENEKLILNLDEKKRDLTREITELTSQCVSLKENGKMVELLIPEKNNLCSEIAELKIKCEKLNEAEKMIENLNRQRDHLSQEKENLSQHVEKLETDCEQLMKKTQFIENFNEEKESFTKEISELTAVCDKLREEEKLRANNDQEMKELSREKEDLNREINALRADCEMLKEKERIADQEKKDFLAEISQLKIECQKFPHNSKESEYCDREDLLREIAELKEKIENFSENLDNSSSSVKEIDDLKAINQLLLEDIKELKPRADESRRLEMARNELRREIDDIKKTNEQLLGDLRQFQTRVDYQITSDSERRMMEKEITDLKAFNSILKKSVQAHEHDDQSVENAWKDEKIGFIGRIDNLERTNEEMKVMITKMREDINESDRTKLTLRGEIQSLRTINQKLAQDLEKSRKLSDQKLILDREKSELCKKIDTMERENMKVVDKMKRLKEKSEKDIRELEEVNKILKIELRNLHAKVGKTESTSLAAKEVRKFIIKVMKKLHKNVVSKFTESEPLNGDQIVEIVSDFIREVTYESLNNLTTGQSSSGETSSSPANTPSSPQKVESQLIAEQTMPLVSNPPIPPKKHQLKSSEKAKILLESSQPEQKTQESTVIENETRKTDRMPLTVASGQDLSAYNVPNFDKESKFPKNSVGEESPRNLKIDKESTTYLQESQRNPNFNESPRENSAEADDKPADIGVNIKSKAVAELLNWKPAPPTPPAFTKIDDDDD